MIQDLNQQQVVSGTSLIEPAAGSLRDLSNALKEILFQRSMLLGSRVDYLKSLSLRRM